MSIAERLKKARSDAGLTLEELASLTGISKTYLWELENDKESQKRPSADILLKIVEAVKITMADLLGLPSIEVNKKQFEVSRSLMEFKKWMKETKQELSEGEFNDLAAMRFRGGQPKKREDWLDLFMTLKRTTKG